MTIDVILDVNAVSRAFGGLQAVDKASLSIERGKITGLIGPNGAGKSTLVNIITGHTKAQEGTITFAGRETTNSAPFEIARQGLIRTFQLSSEFPNMTLLENMLVAPKQVGTSFWSAMFRKSAWNRQEYELLEKARHLLSEFGLYRLADEYAGNLSGGQKRLLEIARALMADPVMLVLDEPMAGVSGVLIDRLVDHILDLNRTGLTFLVIEHDLEVIDRLCSTVYAMAQGSVLASGTMEELRQNESVLEAYLD